MHFLLFRRTENQNNAIDAEGFVKSILKDAFSDSTDFAVMR